MITGGGRLLRGSLYNLLRPGNNDLSVRGSYDTWHSYDCAIVFVIVIVHFTVFLRFVLLFVLYFFTVSCSVPPDILSQRKRDDHERRGMSLPIDDILILPYRRNGEGESFVVLFFGNIGCFLHPNHDANLPCPAADVRLPDLGEVTPSYSAHAHQKQTDNNAYLAPC